MSGKDLVEEIDLTRAVPRWRVVSRRNQEYVPCSDLIYYSSSAQHSASSFSGPVAMGSRGGSDEVPAAAAATANDALPAAEATPVVEVERAEDAVEPSEVPSEAVPTPIEEEGQVDPALEKQIEDDLLKGLEADRKVIEAELDARLAESIEALTGYTPQKRAGGESRHDYEVRLRSWVTTIENPSLKNHAKVLAEGLLEGANRTKRRERSLPKGPRNNRKRTPKPSRPKLSATLI